MEAPCSPPEVDYEECARPVESPEGKPAKQGKLEHFQW